ncbi:MULTISPECIES: SDR family NAD(P)-dependent oxidoreductase [Streptomyces]|uniref:SDR family NAD(P)-dependent oxidoreductase n=1 Tax=Streptomyces caniscabiei TaxID=2746961 RepID=A0ABU4N081_9ACTN|nr:MULTISPECIES: SDR family NAD(P)-dependent oxidoreductase [Streptomyces]MBE4741297.1 SDR family oxidoreductase [Streptomyces caniscabiei]MBE4760948.1 SDR family oxidoreductase [Streptomyces caniscabiei]MBE4774895.1 SDR family oxidoreductase [Streptomyces caniscabiei]MBE4789653.1 SDR family oxidoreductase [Streptomyces caniscabiei]MBE4798836.1 SDR family oxidoreductase [Streptomyces caniscabiei]
MGASSSGSRRPPAGGRLAGRTALVTGAASGIGLATVSRFADEGARVLAVDLDAEGTARAVAGIAGAIPVGADVRDSGQVDAAYERALTEFGRLDIAVNAAGVSGAQADICELTDEDFAEVIAVNLTGTFYSVRAAVRLMRRNSPSGGSVVNVSSVGALANFPLPAMYPASKAGVLGLTRAVAALVADDGIRVNAVAPGATDTPMLPTDREIRRAVVGLGVLRRAASAEEIAHTILFLAGDESAFYTGQTLSPNGGYVMH